MPCTLNSTLVRGVLTASLGADPGIVYLTPVGGGDINDACMVATRGGNVRYFAKYSNSAVAADMLTAEYHSLTVFLERGSPIRTPNPVGYGCQDGQAVLGTVRRLQRQAELPQTARALRGRFSDGMPYQKEEGPLRGAKLAELHLSTREKRFGFDRDNYIGTTPQTNDWSREGESLKLAEENGLKPTEGTATMLEHIDVLFGDYMPEASLVHGDLWGGNASFDRHGRPVLYDPAAYYGDREVDIAMTKLFGGFGRGFYSGYSEVYPLDAGHSDRVTLYNLYHILNHYNLFGAGYASMAMQSLEELCRECLS